MSSVPPFWFFFFFSILIKIFWPTEHCAIFKKASMHMHSWSYIHKYTKYFHLISVKLESKCMICQVHLFQVNDGMTMKGSIEQWSCWLCLWRDLNLEPHNQKSGMHSNTAMAILPSGDYFVFCCFFFFFFFFFFCYFLGLRALSTTDQSCWAVSWREEERKRVWVHIRSTSVRHL